MNEFKAITNIQSDDIAYVALSKGSWNLQAAVTAYFEHVPNNLLNHNLTHQNNTNNNYVNNNSSEESTISYYASYIPGLTTLGGVMNGLFGYIGSYYPYIVSIFSLSPTNVSYSEILHEFQNKNEIFLQGNNQLIFRNVPFSELMNSNKCIFIYFHDNNSNLCSTFNKNILCNSGVVDYLRLNMECWIGDLRNNDGQRIYQQIVNDQRLPFVCIAGIHPYSNKLVLVHRQYVGDFSNSSPLLFVGNILDHGLQRWQQFKSQQVSQRQLSDSNRSLRQLQDDEYQKLLNQQQQQQQHGELQELEEIDNVIQQQQEIQRFDNKSNKQIENKIKMSKRKIDSLSSIIEKTTKDKLVKIALRLPNGKRVQHIFSSENTVESLFDLALCYELKIDDEYIKEFELVCSYPKRVFNKKDTHLSLEKCGIVHSAMLFVQAI